VAARWVSRLAWRARVGRAGVALLLLATPAAAAPWISGSVAAGTTPDSAIVELYPILPDFELGRARLDGVERFAPAATARSSADGRFRLEAPRTGLYRLVVRVPGSLPVQTGPLALVEDLEVAPVAPPPDAGMELQVVDAQGRPIGGAWAFASGDERVENGWRVDFRLGKTAADGRLTLPRRAGESLGLSVLAPAWGEVRVDPFAGGQVRAPAAGAFRRLRVESAAGAPLAGVILRYGALAWPLAASDADGLLRLPPARAGREELLLVPPGGPPYPLPAAKGGAEAPELTARLPAAATLLGRVVDARTGRPVAGALAWSARDPGGFVATDENGRYRLAVSPADPGAIEVAAADFLKARVEVAPAQARLGRAPTLGLEKASTLTGDVVAGGRPIAGALVEAVLYAARGERPFDPRANAVDRAATDARGGFQLRRLQQGKRYELLARRDGYFPAAVETTAPEEKRRIELASIRALSGQVKDPQGQPLAGVEIEVQPAIRAGRTPSTLELRDPRESAGAPLRTDARGRFLLAAPPAAAIDAVFRKPGYAPLSLRRVRILPGDGPSDLGQVVLRPGSALQGRVVDTAGKPVAAAKVFLLEEEPPPFEDPSIANRPSAETSRAGDFAFRDLPAAVPLHLFVRADGYRKTVVRGIRPPREQPLVVTLESGNVLRGVVVDEAGSPVPGAAVEATWPITLPGDPEHRLSAMTASAVATTRSSGRFEIEGLPAGSMALTVEAHGFVSKDMPRFEVPRPAGAPEVEVVLERGALLAGHITTTADEPVAGARIAVGDAALGVSDQEGQYLVEGAPPGRQRISVFHPDYPRFEATRDLGPELNNFDVRLEAGAEVSGRVVDVEGRGVAGARVGLRGRGRGYATASATDGSFVFPTVARARYRLGAAKDGYAVSEAPDEIAVEREALSGLEVVLREGATIAGLVLGLDADELSRVDVQATAEDGHQRRAEIDAAGRYRLVDLEPGDWTIEARLPYGERQVTVRQPVALGDRAIERNLEFRRRLRLAGQVLLHDEPLPNATISLRGSRLSTERSSRSDFDGRFRLDDLEPDTYALGIAQPAQLISHNQTVALDEDRELEIRLRPTTVRGRAIAAATGKPVPGARITLHHLATPETPEFLVSAAAGQDGRFDLPRVGPGTYRLEATADGYVRLEQPLLIDAEREPPELDVRLEGARGLDIDVRLADGSRPSAVHVLALDAAGRIGAAATLGLNSAGRAKLSTLQDGEWMLFVGADGAAGAAVDARVPGAPVAVVLPPAGRLHVRIASLVESGASATLRLFNAAGQPLWTIGPGGLLLGDWELVGGQATVTGLPEGFCTIDVTASDGHRWSSPAAVVASQEIAALLD